jgi:DNA-binding protein HU-beta
MAGKSMSKSQLISYLADKSGQSKKDMGGLLEMIVNTAYDETKKSGEFTIPGLGKLVKKQRAARQGRNPATGATIQIPAKTVVKFRLAKAAKEAILGK